MPPAPQQSGPSSARGQTKRTAQPERKSREELRTMWGHLRTHLSIMLRLSAQEGFRENLSPGNFAKVSQKVSRAAWLSHDIAGRQERPVKNGTPEGAIRACVAVLLVPFDMTAGFMKPLAYHNKMRWRDGYTPYHRKKKEAAEFAVKAIKNPSFDPMITKAGMLVELLDEYLAWKDAPPEAQNLTNFKSIYDRFVRYSEY